MTAFISCLILVASFSALADNDLAILNPTNHFGEEHGRIGEFNAQEVEVDGTRYLKLMKNGTSLYLPVLTGYSAKDLESGFCAPQQMHKEVVVGKVEQKVSQNISAYSSVVINTMRTKCNEGATPTMPIFEPVPEVGVKYTPAKKNPSDPDTEYKAFISPGVVGVGSKF
jgi:hypothetical protein